MTLTDKELDTILSRRVIEPPSADLAARILRAAHHTQQQPQVSWVANLRAALEFLIPHPKAAFASVLVLGLVMGMSIQNIDLFNSETINNIHIDFDEKGGIL